MAIKIEEQVVEINNSLKNVSDKIKGFAEQAEKTESLTVEMKAKIDDALVEQSEVSARLKKAEQVIAELESGTASAKRTETLGQFVARQEAVKGYTGGSLRINAASVDNAVTSDTGDGKITHPHVVPGIFGAPNRPLRIRDLLNDSPTATDSIAFTVEKTFTNNAAAVAENPSDAKPQSVLKFEPKNAPVATIAHWLPASKQALADVGQLAAFIDSRLRYGLDLAEEDAILKGQGGVDLEGLFTLAADYNKPSGAVSSNETGIDVLRLAILQAELSDYFADGIVLSPTAWANIELLKDDNQNYLFSNPHVITAQGLWGRPVVTSRGLSTDEYLVGNFGQAATLYDREQTTVTIAEQHGDFFVRNMVAILAEKRVALAVHAPAALVRGLLDGSAISST